MSKAPTTSPDIESLRLPIGYGANHDVQKLTVTVPVGKPSKTQFFRAHPDDTMVFRIFIYEDKDEGTTYALDPKVAAAFPDIARPVELYRAIDRHGNQRLIPVPLPGDTGQRNPWHESLLQAVLASKTKWVRVAANRSAGAYGVAVAKGDLAAPIWPDDTIEELVRIAFHGRQIKDLDHPVIKAIQGLA